MILQAIAFYVFAIVTVAAAFMVIADQLGVDRQMATAGTAGILAVSEYAEFTRAQPAGDSLNHF